MKLGPSNVSHILREVSKVESTIWGLQDITSPSN